MGLKEMQKIRNHMKLMRTLSEDYESLSFISRELRMNYYTIQQSVLFFRVLGVVEMKEGSFRWKKERM